MAGLLLAPSTRSSPAFPIQAWLKRLRHLKATIQIYSDVTGWTAQRVYELLRANALQLGRIGLD